LRQACDQTAADRIVRYRKDYGDDGRCLLRNSCVGACREDDIDLKANEFSRDLCDAFGAGVRPAILDQDGATLDPVEFTQSLHKSIHPWPPYGGIAP
jgi:hypothetical protein